MMGNQYTDVILSRYWDKRIPVDIVALARNLDIDIMASDPDLLKNKLREELRVGFSKNSLFKFKSNPFTRYLSEDKNYSIKKHYYTEKNKKFEPNTSITNFESKNGISLICKEEEKYKHLHFKKDSWFIKNKNAAAYSAITKKNKRVISINISKEQTISEIRFIIAHQIGHHALDHLKNTPKKVDHIKSFNINHINSEEFEASIFSTNLLIPNEAIEYLIYERSVSSVEDLSFILQVPEMAMVYKLEEMHFIG